MSRTRRNPGAPLGNLNALKHGRRSARLMAERREKMRAEEAERNATNLPLDYKAIVAEIKADLEDEVALAQVTPPGHA